MNQGNWKPFFDIALISAIIMKPSAQGIFYFDSLSKLSLMMLVINIVFK